MAHEQRPGADQMGVPVPGRRVSFAYPENLRPAWNPRRPEFAFAFAANSV